MDNKNTSIFSKLKSYYNKKPIRIIISLIIIAGIMVGIAFGIIALVRALTNTPCPNGNIRYNGKTEGTRGFNAKGLCGPKCKSDEEICPTYDKNNNITAIKCVPKCPDKFTYDANTCNDGPYSGCKRDCPINNDTKNILYDTPYYDDVNKVWACGQLCPNSDSKYRDIGNNLVCPGDNPKGVGTIGKLCVKANSSGPQSVDDNKNTCKNINVSEYCNVSKPQNAQFVKCIDNRCKENDNNRYYCDAVYCDSNTYMLCNDNDDCFGEVKCQNVPSNLNPLYNTLKSKKLENDIKICYSDKYKEDYQKVPQKDMKSCCSLDQIGFEGISKCCENKKIGINSGIQCDQSNFCATKLCNNSWQEDDNDNVCYTGTDNITKNFLNNNGYCCPNGHSTGGTGSGFEFCCPLPVGSLPESSGDITKNNVCMNTTPDNLNDFKNIYNDLSSSQVECKNDDDCKNLNDNLKNSITYNTSNKESPYYKMSNSLSEQEYSTFLCSNNKFKKDGNKYIKQKAMVKNIVSYMLDI